MDIAASSSTFTNDFTDYFRKGNSRTQTRQDSSNDVTNQANDHPKKSYIQRGKTSQCATLGILIDRPKHRLYVIVQSRIASFKNWPENKTQDIKQLAEAGFVYTGIDDSVRCFYCNIGLRDWPEGACPWVQHILANSTCGHVIQCKGKGYVRRILGESEQNSDDDIDDSEEVIDIVQLVITRNQEAVMAAKEFCSNDDILKRAIKTLIGQDFQKMFKAVELVKTIQDIEEVINAESFREDKDDIDTDGGESESDEDIEEVNRTLKDPVTCKICFDAIACIITLPCGHMVSCSQCISALTTCAICRAQIKGTVRARMAV